MIIKRQEKLVFIFESFIFILCRIIVDILTKSRKKWNDHIVTLKNFILNFVTVQLIFKLDGPFQVVCFS